MPFSSLPKYVVHFSLRASLLNSSELFLHLPEQNHRMVPSFLMYIMPVPLGKSLPQNEHFRGLGICFSSVNAYLLLEIFFASLSVSLSIRMSCARTGPLTFRVIMRPLSFPSKMRTRTCEISPVTPVRPITWITSDGISASSPARESLLITEVLFSLGQCA